MSIFYIHHYQRSPLESFIVYMCTLYSVHCVYGTLYNVQSIVYNEDCILYSGHIVISVLVFRVRSVYVQTCVINFHSA